MVTGKACSTVMEMWEAQKHVGLDIPWLSLGKNQHEDEKCIVFMKIKYIVFMEKGRNCRVRCYCKLITVSLSV
jgi:hypothetical protein